jgi:hypothetical protein
MRIYMKKLIFLLAYLFTLMFLITGCQQDMAVSPDDDTVLDKPIKSNTISGGLTLDPVDYMLDLNVEWLPVSRATHYEVSVVGSTQPPVTVTAPEVSASFVNVVLVAPVRDVTINLTAYGVRKNGNTFVAGTGTKTFTYTFTPPSDIVISGGAAPNSSEYIDLTAGWTAISGAVSYHCTLARTLNGVVKNYTYDVTSNSLEAVNISAKAADASFTLTVEAKNSLGVVINTGTKTITYTYIPLSVPNIELSGQHKLYYNYYLDLTVFWAPVEGAVMYHCVNYISSSSTIHTNDHDYEGWGMSNVNPITPGVFNIITVEAKNSSGEIIATGTKIFTYNP